MPSLRKKVKVDYTNKLRKVVGNYLLLVFSLSFIAAFSADTPAYESEASFHNNFSVHNLDDVSGDLPHYPALPGPDQEPSVEPDDTEENENPNKYWNTTRENYKVCSLASGRSQHFNFLKSVHNLKSVPLFILYHSWKIFLS
jgi:hypothetical protein